MNQGQFGYAYDQLRRALRHAGIDSARAAGWRAVLDGMADGTLTVGSRTPVADTPAWVTLEVLHGGFASGRYLAEEPLREDEIELVRALPGGAPGTTDRERLNLHYLTDEGQAALLGALAAGTYRVEIPEHAALMTVAWLLAHDHHAAALDLVATVRPLMHRLRLTPVFGEPSVPAGSVVKLQSVEQVKTSLRAITTPSAIDTMRTRLRERPLYDRLVELWCETVEGEPPTLQDDGVVTGGWPCRVWPADWSARRTALLAETEGVTAHPRANFTRLRTALAACETDSRSLTARDVGWVRRALANTIGKHGAPGSERRTVLREAELSVVERPTRAELAEAVAVRLDAYPDDGGLPSVEPVTEDVDGWSVPDGVVVKVSRAWEAPVEELVSQGVITSGEVLATVLPQITASLLAANIEDPALSALYARTYTAFRRRRSLLLLDLATQVGFTELPWVAALEPLRVHRRDAAEAARQTLAQTAMLALTAFPHTILPNPLVSEFAALAKQAGLDFPLVEEVAADIFMGTFTTKFRDAAVIASRVMAGSLYARYYDLPETWSEETTTRWGRKTAADFAKVCKDRAAEAHRGRVSGVAANGTVLEQGQIVTTHNLAVLAEGLELWDPLTVLAPGLAARSLGWALRRATVPTTDRHAALTAVKNAAYAWRQGIFFLSFCDTEKQWTVVDELRPQLAGTDLGPAVDGLAAVVAGYRFDTDGKVHNGQRWLGWGGGRWVGVR
ncbi:hypothetical protein [Amycolatopsis azurea]|uniref:Uncharacterized protein n=1 Tax=Amycolatopsis azurea DSM 43854 TaxID=1238180 RepID=M2NI32_9PSEU|nr:hypothetical protein [Amycolatopsis azurea]EMD21804.1 hypothetical protein C791_0842 [Amycolatopsis azurea DSM 43854]OOC01572.1 hypothetical protein B0293_35055 [Amycolatopsis azurea DSM 43854]